jgi:hypothetical protein
VRIGTAVRTGTAGALAGLRVHLGESILARMTGGSRWAGGVIAVALALAACSGPPVASEDGGALGVDGGAVLDAGTPAPDAARDRDAEPDRDAAPEPEPEPASDLGDEGQEVWVFVQSHLHTTGFHDCANHPLDPGTGPEAACYSAEGITAFLDEALTRGASDMIITDHNNIEAWFDPAFVPLADATRARYATPLRGTEWSSGDGHMTLLFPREVVADNATAITRGWIWAPGNQVAASVDDYASAIDSVHAEGGIAIINHPELAIHAFPEEGLDADGVEVGIPPNPLDDIDGGAVSLHASAEARRFWQRRLVSGDRLTGTAGADHHHGGGDIPGLEAPTFGIAVNLVRVDPALPSPEVADAIAEPGTAIDQRTAIVIDAVQRGHVMIVEDEDAARVHAGADLDGDGRFHDAREGDCVPATYTEGEVRIRARITGPSRALGTTGYALEVWTEASATAPAHVLTVDYDAGFSESELYRIDRDDPFAIEMSFPRSGDARGFVRFVLSRVIPGFPDDTEVVTNPIYWGDWGAECDGSRPLY